ncbi:hypothetical protein IC619_015425 [Hazenella sp. IB182353]|uniref:hypothetical protein n=1 Tax=Polycladospora coralii TaxID=2771432 RepID=UPI0017460B86|nr:hypothetical protein [Polycladospora coralii]MBS7531863.1 hypothetical protein [Polycladospora coralii]
MKKVVTSLFASVLIFGLVIPMSNQVDAATASNASQITSSSVTETVNPNFTRTIRYWSKSAWPWIHGVPSMINYGGKILYKEYCFDAGSSWGCYYSG